MESKINQSIHFTISSSHPVTEQKEEEQDAIFDIWKKTEQNQMKNQKSTKTQLIKPVRIGESSSGRFLIWHAKKDPDSRNYLGLEIRQKLVKRAELWVKELSLNNIGNEAYGNKNLTEAEDYYTRGLNSVSRDDDTSELCLTALALCYSNRAAVRMSLGRMREALEDCHMAAEIKPDFLKVKVRAANCYLAVGEIKDASKILLKTNMNIRQLQRNDLKKMQAEAERKTVESKIPSVVNIITLLSRVMMQWTQSYRQLQPRLQASCALRNDYSDC